MRPEALAAKTPEISRLKAERAVSAESSGFVRSLRRNHHHDRVGSGLLKSIYAWGWS